MKKRIVIMLSLVLASYLGVSAKRPHKTSHRHRASTSARHHHRAKHKAHKTKDLRPTLTIDDVKDKEHLWGIDISHYQSDINWLALADEKPHFMFIKASEGANFQDQKYSSYYTEARKLGIPVGAYHFFSYDSPGKEQANNFLSVVQHQSGDLLPVLDAEFTRSMPADKTKIKAELIDFVTTIYEKLGFYPIIYCNHRYFETYLATTIMENCKLWIVNYQNQPEGQWTLWQTTDRFKLAAIKGHVDLNFFNGDPERLKELFFQNKTSNSL